MIKHADMLNFWKNTRLDERNKELRPAWWANAALPEVAGAAAIPNLASLYSKAPAKAYTQNTDDINNILEQSGLDIDPAHKPPGRMAKMLQRIFPSKEIYAYRSKPGFREPEPEFYGEHGRITKIGPDSGKWHIPSLTRALGEAQEEHTMGLLPKLLRHSKGLGAAGVIGGGIESFRALSNKSRPVGDRKEMLDTASALSGAGVAPALLSEFRASRNGMNLLKKLPLDNKAEILSEARRFYPRSLSGYALMAAAPVLAPQIAKMFLPRHVD